MKDLETALSLMKAHADLMDFMGPRPEAWVLEAEKAPGAPLDKAPPKQIAEDFGSLLLYLVQRELEFQSEEDLEKDMD